MMCPYSVVHFVGIGGIHMSALAKIALAQGVRVSGSDLAHNEQTNELEARGVKIVFGHAAENVPVDTQAIVFSSATRESNPERVEGGARGLPSYNSHQFLGFLAKELKQIVVTGTHGKSTTTAMMGVMAEAAHLDPMVVVGTRVPQFEEGNVRMGHSDWLIAEGDEFDHHFLAYHPTVLVLNNIEADHFDVYPTIEAMIDAYRSLLLQVVDGGTIVANTDDPHIHALLQEQQEALVSRKIQIKTVGTKNEADVCIESRTIESGKQSIHLVSSEIQQKIDLVLTIPGSMNGMNAVLCYAVSEALGLSQEKSLAALASFTGIWRRLEKIGETNGITVFSDYGHHPTAVTKTLEAVKEFYPDRRLLLCFQPHHRNRTKNLFLEFVPSFDLAEELILVEIYDVAGRDQNEDSDISSQDLCDAIRHHDADRGVKREVQFAADAKKAQTLIMNMKKTGDVIIVMGAGSIYTIAKDL